jgi:hypothetical protein
MPLCARRKSLEVLRFETDSGAACLLSPIRILDNNLVSELNFLLLLLCVALRRAAAFHYPTWRATQGLHGNLAAATAPLD